MNAIIETPMLLTLSDPRARDASLTGGKASALATLTLQGHPVPAGFVLTTAAFTSIGAATGIKPDARRALVTALGSLVGKVAVRSSGVAEDLASASFAGLYETVLDVEGVEAVEAAVARCVASAHAPRVAAYRAEHGIPAAPMAILVQQMVQPRAAGVAFTAHPVTGERDVVALSAVSGLGEALVSGAVDGEEWEVRGAPVRRRGTTHVLAPTDAERVASLARSVAGDKPTDIEWALTGEGESARVHLLQARPMTALPDPVRWDPPRRGAFVRNFRLGEWLGAPMTPLCASWVVPELERQLHEHFADISGVRMDKAFDHVVLNGWYFYAGMNIDMGFWASLRALPRIVSILLSKRRAEFLAAVPPLAHLGFDAELARWRAELLPALRAAVEESQAQVERADADGLLAIVTRVLDHTGQQLGSIVGVAGYAAKAELALFELCKKHLPKHDGSVVALVAGAHVAPSAHDVEGLDPVFPTLGERGALPPAPSDDTKARVMRQRDEAEAAALAAAPIKVRDALRKQIAVARHAHGVRLEQTGLMTLGWPVLRRALLRLGALAEQNGNLARAEDVFFLTRAELEAAARGGQGRVDVRERRATWERQRKLAPPLLVGEPIGIGKNVFPIIEKILHHEEREAPGALVGMPGSPGRVTGPARVVRSVDELSRLKPGEILVAPVTTPAWTLAFSRAIAVVTDTGSIASHASIVAREHGIPAVVATGNGTARIVDGQMITVDGGRGVVRFGPVV